MRFSLGKIVALCGAAAMVVPLAACGTTQSETSDGSGKTVVNVWAWDNNLKANAKVFMKKNPNIVIKFTNAGSSKDEYKALNNALEAGSGIPDIAMIEYFAIPEYVIKGSLKNLNDYGTAKYKDFYTPGTWNAVNFNGGMYGMPVDSGPMAFSMTKRYLTKLAFLSRQVLGMSSIKMQRRLSRLVHILLMIQGTLDSSMQWSGKQVDTHIPHLKTAPRLPSNSLLIKECRNSVTSGKR